MTQKFDFLICGGKIPGALLAARIKQTSKKAKIAIIESQYSIGSLAVSECEWPSNEKLVSQDMYNFLLRSLMNVSKEEVNLGARRVESIGVYNGPKLIEFEFGELFSEKSFQKLIGRVGVERWNKLCSILNDEQSELLKNKLVKASGFSPKDPFWKWLSCFSSAFGVVNPRESTVRCFKDRLNYFKKDFFLANWSHSLKSLVKNLSLKTYLNEAIVESSYDDSIWKLRSNSHELLADKILVAQSPWEAFPWLRRNDTNKTFIELAHKSSPISIVTLSLKIDKNFESPDLIFIPQECVYVLRLGENELCLFNLIEYETFLEAPEVVKAVKRLKRSRRRLASTFDFSNIDHELLSLKPIGWGQDPLFGARKIIDSFDYERLNKKHLAFCGESYGNSYDPDQNTIKSLLAACSAVKS